jgi:hypothetical protein
MLQIHFSFLCSYLLRPGFFFSLLGERDNQHSDLGVSDLWPRKHSAPGQIGLPQVGFAADGFIPIERASVLFFLLKILLACSQFWASLNVLLGKEFSFQADTVAGACSLLPPKFILSSLCTRAWLQSCVPMLDYSFLAAESLLAPAGFFISLVCRSSCQL